MSFFQELRADMLKYSKKFINKTDIVAQIAKLNIDSEKKKREIVKIKIVIGDYIVEQYAKNDQLADDIIQSKIEKINTIKTDIDHIKIKIDTLKSQLWESESNESESNESKPDEPESNNEDINNPS